MTNAGPSGIDLLEIDGLQTIEQAGDQMAALMASLDYAAFVALDIVYVGGKPRAKSVLERASVGPPLGLSDFSMEDRRRMFELLMHSSAPFRWRSRQSPRVPEIEASPLVFRESIHVSDGMGGLCIPVHSGLNRAGAVMLFGDGKLDLFLDQVTSIQLFCMSWFARVSRLGIDARLDVKLTMREIECLQLAANGLTSEEIGVQINLSRHTVNHHLVSATEKLGALNRTQAVAEAVRMGLLR